MSVQYDTPIQFLKGVGPKLGSIFEKRGVKTVGDLVEWFPRTYEDRRAVRSISTLNEDEFVSLKAQILNIRSFNLGRTKRRIYEMTIGDSTGRIPCKFFRIPYRGYFEKFSPHQSIRVSGKVTNYNHKLEFHHPEIQFLESEDQELQDTIIPIYTETEGLNPGKLRKLIDLALYELKAQIADPLPPLLRQQHNLISRYQAIQDLHKPDHNLGEAILNFKSPAHRRLIFEEFFYFQLHLAKRKQGHQREKGPLMNKPSARVQELIKTLPFELTGAQQTSFADIQKDMASSYSMHRLVQGDVGSGKTVVAFLSALTAIDNGYQVAMMAPTEILAEQHLFTTQKFLKSLGIQVELLVGSMRASEKERVVENLRSGKTHFVIGTHALIQQTVEFQKLGLVIIDEQHRFGVDQRILLKQKGENPHFLVMTATPIPRSLAMTLYGDLDVSVINERPKGRIPIVTRVVLNNKRDDVYGFMEKQIAEGRQAYIVYPLVEESEKVDLKNAIEEFELLKERFPKIRFGLLHGQMRADEKDKIMRQFRDHKLDILVSTTVIEVGVDVPNSNMMIIEHAERFGLSQLHQLRGRIGRGAHKSYCVLMLHYPHSEMAKMRCNLMAETDDGFKIAEADLDMRGPGEFFGTRQSGMPGFKVANMARDLELLQEARLAAFELLEKDPFLKEAAHQKLKEKLIEMDSQAIG